MKASSRRVFRRLGVLGCAALLAVGAGACGKKSHPTEATGNNDGAYVDAGPITYQLQLSRALSPYDVEDKGYLNGVPSSQQQLSASQEWYGVFLWAKNQTHSAATTSSLNDFVIVDTVGDKYHPLAVDSTINPYAWTPLTLQPGETEPTPTSTAFFGPTQGQELLFKLNTSGASSVYSNRPLTLLIYAPGQSKPASISLDL